MRYQDEMSREELRDALTELFNDDISDFTKTIKMSKKNAGNLLNGEYGITPPLRILVRLLVQHPELVAEIKEPIKNAPTDKSASDDMLFIERRSAREEKAREDDEAVAFHRRVMALLADPARSGAIMVDAKGRVAKWEQRGLCSPYYIDAWNAIIELPVEEMASEILRADAEGIALRQNTPFWIPEEEAA
jgi:hypothetical protein